MRFSLALLSYFLWASPLKLISAFSIFLTVNKKAYPFLLSSLTLVIYFMSLSSINAWDFKIILIVFQLYMISATLSINYRQRVNLVALFTVIVIWTLIQYMFTGDGRGFNLSILNEGERIRNYFPWELSSVALFYIRNRFNLFIACLLLSTCGFMFSGDRGAALFFLGLGILLVMTGRSPFLIFIYVLIYHLALGVSGYFIPFGSFLVKSETFYYCISHITLLPHGITPPLNSALYNNVNGSFFVPADVGFVGKVYEIGLFLFILKFLYAIVAIKINRTDPPVIYLLSMVLFGYNLTQDFFELLIVFVFLFRTRLTYGK